MTERNYLSYRNVDNAFAYTDDKKVSGTPSLEYIKPLTLTDDDVDLEAALLLASIDSTDENPLLQQSQQAGTDSTIKILGDFEFVEEIYLKDRKKIDRALNYYTSAAAAFSASGCCGGHSTTASSKSTDQLNDSHKDHDHCQCGGHFNDGKCDKCGKGNSRTRKLSHPINHSSSHDYMPVSYIGSRQENPRHRIHEKQSYTLAYDRRKSMIEVAKERGHDRIVLMGGLFIYRLEYD